jgi:hypothetical protein
MAEVIFFLCAIGSAACALALLRGFYQTSNRLLLWSGACFAIFALGNVFLFIDLIVYPDVDLHGPVLRSMIHAVAGATLLTGLILELS